MNIKAKEIAITKDNGVLIIVFLDELEQKYFMIQDALEEYDEQDIKLSQNTYYIEINDQFFSTYGGIATIKINTQRVTFILDAKGVERLRKYEIIIDFTLSKEKYLELERTLREWSNKHAVPTDFRIF